MKLDKRIKDRNHIFDCFNAEDAKQYIGEECYMTDNLELFDNLDILYKYRLDSIYDNSYFYNAEDDDHFKFCLPVRLVSELKEKKYRPYTIEEFCYQFPIGKPVIFRRKEYKELIHNVMFIGYREDDEDITLLLGNAGYSLEELFNEYEWAKSFDSNEFKSFGVEE